MFTCLVVGNQTLASRELMEALQARARSAHLTAFHVVVPQTPLDHYRWPVDGHQLTVAEHRLGTALQEFAGLPASVTGEVGHEHPLRAIEHALGKGTYAEILLSTYPAGISRWLGADLPSQIARRFDVPLTHIIAAGAGTLRDTRRRYEELVETLRTQTQQA